ncbi:MAG: phosphatidate cytidylyltransferase [Clostridia bacterium]
MLKRILIAIPLVALLAAVIYFGGILQSIAFTVVAIISVDEMARVFKKKGIKPFLLGVYLFAAGYYTTYILFGTGYLMLLLAGCVVLTIAERFFCANRPIEDLFYSLIIFIYPLLLYVILMYATQLQDASMSHTALFAAFAGPLMGDTLAYFIGTFWGKHKLCPGISPHKTIEGSFGGTLGGVIGGLLVFYMQRLWNGSIPMLPLLVMGFMCGILGQIGDLFASTIKRWAGIKDYGTIFPGHGGILDRLDSVLMCAPVIFAYFYVIG